MSKFRKYIGVIAQGIFLGLLSAVIFITAQQLFSAEGLAQRLYKQFVFENTVQAAFSYQKRNFDFVGVCEDTAFLPYIRCIETGERFKLEMRKADDGFYCADSTGFKGVVMFSTGNADHCQGK